MLCIESSVHLASLAAEAFLQKAQLLATNDPPLGYVEQGLRSLYLRFAAGASYVDKTVALTW